MRSSLLSLAVAASALSSAQAQSPSYHYGRPPSTFTSPAPGPAPSVVYGSGMGRPVEFGTPRSTFYSPGFASSRYRYLDAVYTPPGAFETPTYDAPTFATRPSFTYIPGYLSYTYTPAVTPFEITRPNYSSPRLYFGNAELYRGR